MNKHSINIQNLIFQFAKDKLQILKISNWTPLDENGVAFRINKTDFVGTFNVFKTKKEDVFEVLFKEDSWEMMAGTFVNGEELVCLLTELTGFGKKEEPKREEKWEAGNRNLERAEGGRAPSETNMPISAN